MKRLIPSPLVVLVVGLLATSAGLVAGLHADNEAQASEFSRLAERTAREVESRLRVPRYGLAGARGTVAALGRIPDVDAFRRYTRSRDLPREFPGVSGIGLILRVARDDLATFEADVRRQRGDAFAVRGDGDFDDLYVIRSIEPESENLPALGFDVGSEPLRRAAIERVFALGVDTATAAIELLQDPEAGPATLYMLPVFASGGAARASPDDAVVGVFYAAITYRAILQDLMPDPEPLLFVQLRDIDAIGAAGVVYRSATAPPAHPDHRRNSRLDFGGREFELSVASLPALDRRGGSPWVWLSAALGALVTLLAAALVRQLERTRAHARQLAHEMTVELDRLATVARLTGDAVVVTDPDGRATWGNPAFFKLTGYTAEEIIGKRPEKLLVCEGTDAGTIEAIRDAVKRRAPFQGELLNRARDGREYWVRLEIQPMCGRDGELEGLIAIQSDITAARSQAIELAESHAFLERIGAVAGIGGWQVDLTTGVVTWTPEIRALLEAPSDYLSSLDSDLERFIAVESRPLLRERVERCIEDGTPWDLELPIQTYRGRRLWARSVGGGERVGGVTRRLMGALQDITDRKLAQIAEAESRNLLQTTLGSIADAVLTTDAEARVQWLNAAAETLTGWRREEARGRPVDEVLSLSRDDGEADRLAPVATCLRERRVVALGTGTVLIRRDDAMRFTIEESAAPLLAEDGRLLGAVIVFRDITERLRLEREEVLHRSRRELNDLTDTLSEGFLVLDRDWNVLGANPALGDMLGVVTSDVLGRSVWECLPSFQEPRVADALRAARLDGRARAIELTGVSGALLAGRVHRHYDGLAVSLLDVTLERRQQQKVERSADLFRAVNRAALVAARKLGDDDLLQVLVEELRGAVEAHLASIHIVPRDGERHPPPAVSLSDKYAHWRSFSAPVEGLGLLAEAARGRGVIRLTQEELQRHPAFGGFGAAGAAHPPLRGLLSVALLERSGALIGFLQVSDRIQGEFDDDDVATCVQFGQIVAITMEWGKHIHQLESTREQLRTRLQDLQGQRDLLAASERLAGSGSWLLWSEAGEERVEWSGATYRMLGCDPARTRASIELLLEHTHASDRAALERALSGARQSGAEAVVEHRLRIAGGAERWVRHRIRVLEHESGRLRLLGILQGIALTQAS